MRNLFQRGLSPRDVRELFRVIDWLMELPPLLKTVFWQDVEKMQEEGRMPFISTPEWYYLCQGLRRGIESLLRVRFGEEGLKLMPEIREVHEEEKLEAIIQALESGASLEDVRRVWLPPAS